METVHEIKLRLDATAFLTKNDVKKQFNCKKCPGSKSFIKMSAYIVHQFKVHKQDWHYWCNICSTQLPNNANDLYMHVISHDSNDIIISEEQHCFEFEDDKSIVLGRDNASSTTFAKELTTFDARFLNNGDEFNDSLEEDSSEEVNRTETISADELVEMEKIKLQMTEIDVEFNGNNEISFCCSWCPDAFADYDHYKLHVLRKHAKGRKKPTEDEQVPILCDNCGRYFAKKSNFRAHLRTSCGSFDCCACSQTFHSASLLKRHFFAEHKERMARCRQCKELLPVGRIHDHNHERHGNIKDPGQQFECDFCQEIFTAKVSLCGHLRKHIQPRPVREPSLCMYCGKTFKLQTSLTKHLQCHSNSLRFKCEVCHGQFSCDSELKRHFMAHTGEKPYGCNECPELFKSNRLLRRHMEVAHNFPAVFKCDTCGDSCTNQVNLNRHIQKFGGSCAPMCRYCGERIPRSILTRHELTHTNIKMFPCPLCQKSFTRKEVLEQHLNLHTGERPFKCSLCDESFAARSSLHRHRRQDHEGKKSPKRKTVKKNNNNNVSNQILQCADCEYTTPKQCNLYAHIYNHHREKRRFECSYCGKVYSVRFKFLDHINTHTGAMPFSCPGCCKQFPTRRGLWQHKLKYCRFLAKDKIKEDAVIE